MDIITIGTVVVILYILFWKKEENKNLSKK